jgi:eukaryotic-like serine/threonine-protein kinase
MTTPAPDAAAAATPAPMTPERWHAIEAVLMSALACEPPRREAFVAEACAGDDELYREVASLLAAHDRAGDQFLERPAAEALGATGAPSPLMDRLGSALAGRYVIERELARGGMATVLLAHDLRHDRRVAIKVLREGLAAAVGAERFLGEIRVTASLQHPHILPLFDSGSAEGLLWYVMPFVEGETLRARLAREGRLPLDVALQLAREMAEALEYAHRHGVVHRDVKPENVLLQGGHALVADFGIALALEQAGGERLTRTGISVGTPQYMAPEQAAGDRPIDARTDVYALGVVLHEMLAGESPFGGGVASPNGMLRRVMQVSPRALATRRADVPYFIDAAVRRALAKQPDDRFASAAAFAAALGEPGDPVEWVTPAPAAGRSISARAFVYAAGAMLAIGLAGGWALARSTSVNRLASVIPDAARPPREASIASPATFGGRELSLALVDRSGRLVRTIAANRPWTPRFSPDGRRVAYGAFGDGRNTSDLWVTDLQNGTTQRLTDDDGDSNDPQWSTDGVAIAYSASAPGGKDVLIRKLGGAESRVLAARSGTQFPTDWPRSGRALLVTEQAGSNQNDILVQPEDGSTPQPYAASQADEMAARVSPDGRWVAYTSDESGQQEVYLDSYPRPGARVMLSANGGKHPVWRADGRELFYWSDGALTAVRLDPSAGNAPPTVGARTMLFRSPYLGNITTLYDVSPDGQQFVIVRPDR